MFELGQMLKQARLERGISIEDLQESTKIRKRYLEAIEEGNFKVLPGNFYVRAFIKSYAEAVGLNPVEVLGMYKNVIPSASAEPAQETNLRRTRSKSKMPTDSKSTWITGIILWAFLILILGILYYIISNNDKAGGGDAVDTGKHLTEKTPGPSTAPSLSKAPSTTPTPTPTPAPTEAATVVFSERIGSVDHFTVAGGNGKMAFTLNVKDAKCWVEVYRVGADGQNEKLVFKTMNPGETFSIDSEQPIYVSLGFAKAAEFVINGITVPTKGSSGSEKYQFNIGQGSVNNGQ